ncbi:hypothetical protein [Sphingomonas xinjiangensis]|uniref:Uncharacterized protein n=1 Tax=Sphingomonas xinjiangensis TaxID=643568 RepID=A0A840YNU1_9SPHN|nr:hypothetical protein [Sphingomonas xinjiangensis]MBB5709611.1 hypothetical protein [Sphingomonas xinjiangensis]
MKRIATAALLGMLAACGAPEAGNQPEQAQAAAVNEAEIFVPQGDDGNSAQAAAKTPALGLSPDGLTLVSADGSARQVNFGIAQDDAMRAASVVAGKPGNPMLNPDCPSGPLDSVDFADGLTLFFEGARFVGWDVDDTEPGRFTTMSGVGIGTTRRAMERSVVIEVENTSLGHEFRAGALSGLLSAPGETGRVMQLWAGTTCIFR